MNSTIVTTRFDKNSGMITKKVLLCVQIVYGFPIVCLMGYIFVHLATSAKYKNSFYRLVQVDLIINMTCWLNTWIAIRSMDTEIGNNFMLWIMNILPQTWTVSEYLVIFFFHMQFLSAASLSLHRISSIVFFSSYERFWSRYYPLVVFFFVVYCCLHQLDGPTVTLEIIDGDLFLITDSVTWIALSTRYFLFATAYIVILTVSGIIVARIAFKKLQGTISGDQKISRKLTKIALTSGFVYSGIMLVTLVNYASQQIPNISPTLWELGNCIMAVASDMMTLSLPFILFIFDTNIKRDILPLREASNVNPAVASMT